MNGVKIRENYQRALELYYESAEKGDAYSQLQLGKMFLLGEGVNRDTKAALEWIRKSADRGNGEAQAYLGHMFAKGLEVERDMGQALELYKKSAAQGNARGQANLAGLYLSGAGVEPNPRLAFAWYQRAAEQGNDEAQAQLGRMYEKGLAVNRDIHKAAELYKKAAEQDHPLGQLKLGDFHLNGLAVEQNPRKAFAWYRKAAAQDKDAEIAAQAQLKLGAMYSQGNGVEKDLKKAFEFYERAAGLGNTEAQYCLGAMYEDGVGVERDHKKALEWFQRSASKSKAPSDRAMGDIYRDGLIVEKNIPEAIKWYGKAAAEGDAYAKTELLKLQLEESAPKKAKAGPAPASKGEPPPPAATAIRKPAAPAGEKNRERARPAPERTAENAGMPAPGKPQPAPKPKSAKPQSGKQSPASTSPMPVVEQGRRAKKARAPLNPRYLYSAAAIFVLAFALLWIVFRTRPAAAWESLELGAAPSAALPRPDPRAIPQGGLRPAAEFLNRLNADPAARKKSARDASPLATAQPAAARSEPAALRLRREYRSLDEAEISRMLLARNLFDAQRNPAGNFRHRYELKEVAGLRVIVDHATNLAWTRQQNPVKLSLDKSSQWIASLNRVEFAGGKNWRLPTVEEAASLLGKNSANGEFFLDALFGRDLKAVWTGDGFSASESWIIDFQNGTTARARNRSKLAILMVSSIAD